MSSRRPSNPGPSLPRGTTLQGRYTLGRAIGSGGFGHVYQARDTRMKRDVAVKVLNKASGVDPVLKARFEREALAAGQLRHPHVVEIFDIGQVDASGAPYMVMEFLEGRDLQAELMASGPLDAERALPLFIEVLGALGMAHDKGIVHKDLKPENLFIVHPDSRFEHLKLLDFGVAAFLSDEARLTVGEEFFGTPMYLAPEYIKERAVSPAVDVYQMGLVLAEVLTGQPVVPPDNIHLCLIAHCDGELKLPRSLLQSPLGPPLCRALQRDPERRFCDGHAFAEALAEVDPAEVPRPSLVEPRWRVAALSGSSRAVTVPPSPDTTDDFIFTEPDNLEDSLVGRLLGDVGDGEVVDRGPRSDTHAAGLWSRDVVESDGDLPVPVRAERSSSGEKSWRAEDIPTLPPEDAVTIPPTGVHAPLALDDADDDDHAAVGPRRPTTRGLTAVIAPSSPAPTTGGPPKALIAAGLTLLLLAGGAAIATALMTGEGSQPVDAETAAARRPAATEPSVPSLATTPVPAEGYVDLRLDSDPSGASVYEGDVDLGLTPMVLTVHERGTRKLTVARDGYAVEHLVLTPESPEEITLPLAPQPDEVEFEMKDQEQVERPSPRRVRRRQRRRRGRRPARKADSPTDRAWKVPD